MFQKTFDALIKPVPAHYPNHLASARPEQGRLPRRTKVLLGLVLACLAFRMAMAWRIPSVSPDAVLYIRSAQALEAGNYRVAFDQFRLNIYPAILVGLHKLGFDWETAGMVWGVAISCLVVLPLYGWARRVFDDRVALVACLLYAVQPKLIIWSPEVIRDSTFWFLFMLSLYWLWRAATEVRPGLFVAAGAAVTLASLTRFEGLLLLIPFGAWTLWRFRSLEHSRGKLALGALLGLSAFPLLVMAGNLIWMIGREGWVLPRLEPLQHVQTFIASMAGQEAVEPDATFPPNQRLSLPRMLWVFVPTLTRGLSPIFALLMFAGIWRWRGVWARRDQQALFYTCLAILAGIWIHLWYDRAICPRYALPIVLMASVYAALGLIALTERLLRWQAWFHPGRQAKIAAMLTPLAVIAIVGVTDALTSERTYLLNRKMAKDMGQWVQQEFGPSPVMVGPVGFTPIARHYADRGVCCTFRTDTSDENTILSLVQQHRPDLLFVQPTKRMNAQRTEALIGQLKEQGFETADFHVPAETESSLHVLRRCEPMSRIASDPRPDGPVRK